MTKTLKTYNVHFEVTNDDNTHLRGGSSIERCTTAVEARRNVKNYLRYWGVIAPGERLRILDVVKLSQ